MSSAAPGLPSDAPATDPLPALAAAVGARPLDDHYGPGFEFGIDGQTARDRITGGFVAALPDLGLIRVTGDDGAKFLHSQLTNTIEQLAVGDAGWNGYCTAKGRMLGSFIDWRDAEAIWLAASRPLVAGLRQRLSMFVLRAKARLDDVSGGFLMLGVGGERAATALAARGWPAPGVMKAGASAGIAVIGLPEVSLGGQPVPRWLLRVPLNDVIATWSALADSLAPVSTETWRWTEILSGVPRIVEATREAFVPQMVNFELVGGVDFKKGCYPGQEIVARSQYLGKLKRRMFLGHLDAGELPAPGSDVIGADGAPAGQVVMAARHPMGGIDLLFECPTATIDGGVSAAGRRITVSPLPYPVPQPAAA